MGGIIASTLHGRWASNRLVVADHAGAVGYSELGAVQEGFASREGIAGGQREAFHREIDDRVAVAGEKRIAPTSIAGPPSTAPTR